MAVIFAALASAAAPAFAAGCKIGKIAELPVTMNGLRPMITAKINGADAQFIADSGAFFSLIAPASAAEYQLTTRSAPFHLMLEGVGGRTEAKVTTVKEFTLAGVPLKNIEFVVGGGQPGGGAVGLLGQNVLRIADVEYDLSNGAIRLMKPDGCGKTNMAYWAKEGEAYSVVEIAWATAASPHITSTALLNGTKVRVLFDTGAATSVLNLRAAARAGVKPDSAGVVKAGYSRGIGSRAIQTWVAPFASFKIGDEEIRNTRLRMGDIGDVGAEMLIGADFFLSHRIYVASSQRRLYFTYNGGPVFNLMSGPQEVAPGEPDHSEMPATTTADTEDRAPITAASVTPANDDADSGGLSLEAGGPGDANPPAAAAPPIPSGEPTDAAGFSRRGTAFAARRDFTRALADLTRACELGPTVPDYFFERGRVQLARREPALAIKDFDQALKLKPDHVPTLMARAALRLARSPPDTAGSMADLDKVNDTVAKESDVRFALGNLYSRARAIDPAIAQYDLWIEKHSGDARLPDAYAARCRIRGLMARELDKALADCNRAVKARPESGFFRDSRGLLYLRMGELDKAIADYDAVMRLQPNNPTALYGRGIAKVRKGLTAEGQADIAASKAISPRVADEAARRGLAP
jgi:tetratricopeptide (TPR) repeat protein/predicted aspartyl protease